MRFRTWKLALLLGCSMIVLGGLASTANATGHYRSYGYSPYAVSYRPAYVSYGYRPYYASYGYRSYGYAPRYVSSYYAPAYTSYYAPAYSSCNPCAVTCRPVACCPTTCCVASCPTDSKKQPANNQPPDSTWNPTYDLNDGSQPPNPPLDNEFNTPPAAGDSSQPNGNFDQFVPLDGSGERETQRPVETVIPQRKQPAETDASKTEGDTTEEANPTDSVTPPEPKPADVDATEESELKENDVQAPAVDLDQKITWRSVSQRRRLITRTAAKPLQRGRRIFNQNPGWLAVPRDRSIARR